MTAAAVRAAGGVLWRPSASTGGVEVAVVHRPRYDDWSLPKGKLDAGEPALVGACREVLEETGFACLAGRTLGISRYRVVQGGREVPKTVRWWALRALDGEFMPTAEVDELRWMSPAVALRALTAGRDVEPLRAFLSAPARTRSLLLVRHGSAGDRRSFPADDDVRPLDDDGRAQARALADVLRLYGPGRLLAAPLVRCADTLRPLAAALGLHVGLDPVLAAGAYREDAGQTVTRLESLASAGPSTVVCSQGEVLPDVVQALAARHGLDVLSRLDAGGRLDAAKGSVWALSFDDTGRLLDADYDGDPRIALPADGVPA